MEMYKHRILAIVRTKHNSVTIALSQVFENWKILFLNKLRKITDRHIIIFTTGYAKEVIFV
jgi:hypothetical protein